MLVLRGNVGKSVILQSLIESYPDSYTIVYDNEPIKTIETSSCRDVETPP